MKIKLKKVKDWTESEPKVLLEKQKIWTIMHQKGATQKPGIKHLSFD